MQDQPKFSLDFSWNIGCKLLLPVFARCRNSVKVLQQEMPTNLAKQEIPTNLAG